MSDTTFVVHCQGCGDCRAVVVEEVDENVEFHEVARHVLHCLRCATCGEDYLEIYSLVSPTIH